MGLNENRRENSSNSTSLLSQAKDLRSWFKLRLVRQA